MTRAAMPKGCASPGCRISNPGRRLVALPNGSSRYNAPEEACSSLPPERAREDVRFVRLPGTGVSYAGAFSGKHPIVEAAAAVRPCGAGGLWRAKSCRTRTRSPKLSRPSRRCSRSRDMSNAGSSRIWFSTVRSHARRERMSCTSSARASLATPSNPNRRCGGSSLRAGATPTADAAGEAGNRPRNCRRCRRVGSCNRRRGDHDHRALSGFSAPAGRASARERFRRPASMPAS